MNAKQRKQAEKMRDRALLDYEPKIRHLEAMQAGIDKSKAELVEAWVNLAETKVQQEKELEAKRKAHEANGRSFERYLDELTEKATLQINQSILKDVLLKLELEIPPEQIALDLREQFDLAVPVW